MDASTKMRRRRNGSNVQCARENKRMKIVFTCTYVQRAAGVQAAAATRVKIQSFRTIATFSDFQEIYL